MPITAAPCLDSPRLAGPRLAASQRRRGQLPVEVTGFVGRQTELASLSALLVSARLVTITGPGGVGKTRVGLRAAAQAAGCYSGRVCFVELSGLEDPSLLAETVADCLGLQRQDSLPAVLRHLRDRRQLLVLDTCEHLLDSCATFAEAVLREAPGVTVLATSRQPLDVPGEHTLPIRPFPAPSPDDTGSDGAVELFAQRAAAAVPSFRVTAQSRPDIIRLCRQLDGLPLAIEFAAVRLRALPLAELANRLERRFQVLDGGRRGAVPRHQTLRAVMQWSYDLCTPEEQALWTRLSVFSGTFDVPAAEHVCAAKGFSADPGGRCAEIVGPLIGLVDKSVLLRDDAHGARYRLPGPPREFGALRLAADGDPDAWRQRHLSYYLTASQRFRDEILGDRQPERFRELRADHDNLRAALAYGMRERGSADYGTQAAELATALQGYWVMSGRLLEGRYWLGQVAGRFPELSPERARALIVRAYLGALAGESDAVEDAREGIRVAETIGANRIAARGYLHLHAALTFGGWCEEAASAGAAAERLLTEVRDDTGRILLDLQQAYLSQLAGRPEQAIRRCEAALLRLSDRPGDRPGDRSGGGGGGLGDRPGSDDPAKRGARDSGGERWLRGYLHTIAAFARLQVPGEEQQCAASAFRGLCAGHEAGDVIGTAYALEALAWLAAASGRAQRAAWLTGAADRLWERAGKRLSGAATMVEAHQRAVKTASDSLGAERFAVLRARGASHRPETIVAAAVSDIDDLDSGQFAAAARSDGGQEASRTGPGGLPGGTGNTSGTGNSGPAGHAESTGNGDPGPAGRTGAARPAARQRHSELTGRERQIAALVASGLSNREIATRLVISKRTVDAHVEHIFSKLGISSRVQLTLWLRDQPAAEPASPATAGSAVAGSAGPDRPA